LIAEEKTGHKIMRKWRFFLHPVFIFVFAQLAWVSLLGLWIYWYVTNYIILEKVGDKLAPQLVSKTANVITLIWGVVLLVVLLIGMYFIFIYLNRQIHITRLYDNFIASVTHELKSPLASIQLYLDTMRIRDIPKEKQKEFIALMDRDTERLRSLIDSILEISGIEQNKMIFNFKVYPAESFIRELVRETMEKLKIPDSAVTLEGEASCECVCDREAIRMVFDNLFGNAIKYCQNEAKIHIRFSCDKKNLILEFQDQGIGFSKKERKRIFNKFYRIVDENKPNVKGTGLGLYIVKEVIKAHGGDISAFSEGPNKGATFRLELPIYQRAKKRYINKLLRISRRKKKAS